MPRRVIYTSDELDERLRKRASVSGVSVSSLAGVLLDQALVLYDFAAPAASAEELALQKDSIAAKVVGSVLELGLVEGSATTESAGADSVASSFAAPGSDASARPAREKASGGKASSRRRATDSGGQSGACPAPYPGRGVKCKLCGKTHPDQ